MRASASSAVWIPTRSGACHRARHSRCSPRSPAVRPGRLRSPSPPRTCRSVRRYALRAAQLRRLLGVRAPAPRSVRGALEGWACRVDAASGRAGEVTPPAHRFDIAIEADLIEEVARIVGFEAIPGDRCRCAAALQARCPRRSASEVALLEALAGARLPGGDHARLRRPGAAGAAVPGAPGARAGEPDRERPVR